MGVGGFKSCRGYRLPKIGGDEKVPSIEAIPRITIDTRITPGCMKEKERGGGNLRIVHLVYCNLDERKVGFLKKVAVKLKIKM